MRTSIAARSASAFASLTGPTRRPMSGPVAPDCDVEKKTGSISIEVALVAHALHEDRPDHPSPADDAYLHV